MISNLDTFQMINTRYPHIGNRLSELWGSPGFADYVKEIIDSPSGKGFPRDVQMAMAGLLQVHQETYRPREGGDPLPPSRTDPSGNEKIRLVTQVHPRIGEQLLKRWGTQGFSPFVNELLSDSRDGKRAGFANEIAEALFHLMMEHDAEFPQFELKVNDIWSLREEGSQGGT